MIAPASRASIRRLLGPNSVIAYFGRDLGFRHYDLLTFITRSGHKVALEVQTPAKSARNLKTHILGESLRRQWAMEKAGFEFVRINYETEWAIRPTDEERVAYLREKIRGQLSKASKQ